VTDTEDDPRLAFVYQESLRGLLQQQAAVATGALAVVVLWPYYNLSFRFDAQDLLDRYVDTPAPATMAGMHRDLALRAKADWRRNGRVVRRLREAFQLALVLLLVNILAWLFSIAGSPS
jgi:hypothetical protein